MHNNNIYIEYEVFLKKKIMTGHMPRHIEGCFRSVFIIVRTDPEAVNKMIYNGMDLHTASEDEFMRTYKSVSWIRILLLRIGVDLHI